MHRRLAGSLLAALVLALTVIVAGPGGRRSLQRLLPGLHWAQGAGSALRLVLPDGRMVVARGRWIMVEEQEGQRKPNLRLPAAVRELEEGGSPGADLTAITARRLYALGLDPQPRALYSYPRTDSKHDIIIIEKSRNMLYFYQGGRLMARYPVATGKERHFTPEGVFHIAVKFRNPAGAANASSQLGRRWMGLAVPEKSDKRGPPGDTRAPLGQKYGIHGTDEPHTIGSHASAGCVRLHNADIMRLYDQVRVGTAVEIRP